MKNSDCPICLTTVTQYTFYKSLYYNTNTNALEYNYDISFYHTSPPYFEGSNVFITSTWTLTTPILDQILFNNTASAQGKTRVIGTIRHVMSYGIPLPYCPKTLDVTNGVDNTLTLKPI